MQSSRKSLVVRRWLAKTTCWLPGAFIGPETVRGDLGKCRKSLKPQRTRRTAAEIADGFPGTRLRGYNSWSFGQRRTTISYWLKPKTDGSHTPRSLRLFSAPSAV